MNIVWISLVAILLLLFVGYRRGILRIIASIVALLLAGVTAMPLSGVFLPLVQRSGIVPLALQPLAAILSGGIVVFLILSCLGSWILRRRERCREAQDLPRLEPWEKLGGAVLGGLWGCVLVALVVTGLHLLGRVERELAQENAPTSAPKTMYQEINQQIDTSPFAGVVQRVNPAEERIAHVFGNLAIVTSDPVLLERFRQQPAVARLTNLPQLRSITEDMEIQNLLQNRQYYALLNNPKLAALLQDKVLVEECRKLDLETILDGVLKTPR